jgi:hypothetical protein
MNNHILLVLFTIITSCHNSNNDNKTANRGVEILDILVIDQYMYSYAYITTNGIRYEKQKVQVDSIHDAYFEASALYQEISKSGNKNATLFINEVNQFIILANQMANSMDQSYDSTMKIKKQIVNLKTAIDISSSQNENLYLIKLELNYCTILLYSAIFP